jgi:hypothetical protein
MCQLFCQIGNLSSVFLCMCLSVFLSDWQFVLYLFSICMFVFLSICLSYVICLSVCPSICLSFYFLTICLSVFLFVRLSVSLSFCFSVFLFVRLSVGPSFCFSVFLFVRLSVCVQQFFVYRKRMAHSMACSPAKC